MPLILWGKCHFTDSFNLTAGGRTECAVRWITILLSHYLSVMEGTHTHTHKHKHAHSHTRTHKHKRVYTQAHIHTHIVWADNRTCESICFFDHSENSKLQTNNCPYSQRQQHYVGLLRESTEWAREVVHRERAKRLENQGRQIWPDEDVGREIKTSLICVQTPGRSW